MNKENLSNIGAYAMKHMNESCSSEIIRTAYYGPDNYLFRKHKLDDYPLLDMIHDILKAKIPHQGFIPT